MADEILRLERVGLKATVGVAELLRDVSLQVESGDRVGIVGATGAGKTSLLRAINRLSEISQGQIFFAGQNIQAIPVVQLRQQVLFLPQESKLLGMTVQQALAYPLRLRGLSPQASQERVRRSIDSFQIPEDWLARTEAQLSLGQRQWVAIARALLAQPQVLLLDEPTAALDPERTRLLLQLLQAQGEIRSLTVLMVNHQLEWVRQSCQRVIYLQQGQVKWQAETAQVDWTELQQQIQQTMIQDAEEWQ